MTTTVPARFLPAALEIKIPTTCIGLAVLEAHVAGSGLHKALVLVLFGVVLGTAVNEAHRLGIKIGGQALFGTILAGVRHNIVCDVLALLRVILWVELGLTL